MKKCPYCNRDVADDEQVCEHCYADISNVNKEEKKEEEKVFSSGFSRK